MSQPTEGAEEFEKGLEGEKCCATGRLLLAALTAGARRACEENERLGLTPRLQVPDDPIDPISGKPASTLEFEAACREAKRLGITLWGPKDLWDSYE